MAQKSNIMRNSTAAPLNPPPDYYIIENSLYRCSYAINKNHIPFLKKLNLSGIIWATVEPLDASLAAFAENDAVDIHSVITEDAPLPFCESISYSEEWMKNALELLMAFGPANPVLLVGDADLHADSVIIACLRRMQRWCMTSVIDEFRSLTLRRNVFDLEQFIEYFDISLVRYPFSLPDYAVNDMTLEDEEFAWLQECDSNGAPLLHADMVRKLLFNNPQLCISSNGQYDATISLVTDDKDDD